MNVNVVKQRANAAGILTAAAVLGVLFGAMLFAILHFAFKWWPQ